MNSNQMTMYEKIDALEEAVNAINFMIETATGESAQNLEKARDALDEELFELHRDLREQCKYVVQRYIKGQTTLKELVDFVLTQERVE